MKKNNAKAFYAVSEEMYKQAQPQGESTNTNEEDVVDADYEVVDEEE
ncbi:MAG: hypothetical protein ACTHWZ_00745 [Peptoniphilaceae bacterium]